MKTNNSSLTSENATHRVCHAYVGICMLILAFSLSMAQPVKAQFAVQTNVVIPALNLIQKSGYGPGFDLGLLYQFSSNNVLRFSLHHHKLIMSPPPRKVDPDAVGTYISYGFMIKTGLRLGYKHYIQKRDEGVRPEGFYIGGFSDLMYAKPGRHSLDYKYGVLVDEKTTFFNPSHLIAIGGSLGYTFRINRFTVEPNLGVGSILNMAKFRSHDSWFADLDNFATAISVSHLELNIGFSF